MNFFSVAQSSHMKKPSKRAVRDAFVRCRTTKTMKQKLLKIGDRYGQDESEILRRAMAEFIEREERVISAPQVNFGDGEGGVGPHEAK